MEEVAAKDIEATEQGEETNRRGRQLGLPELDPDALPSSSVSKYLNLESITDYDGSSCFYHRGVKLIEPLQFRSSNE